MLEEPLKELSLNLNLSLNPNQEEDWQVSDMGLHHYGLPASTCLTALLVEHLLCEMVLMMKHSSKTYYIHSVLYSSRMIHFRARID